GEPVRNIGPGAIRHAAAVLARLSTKQESRIAANRFPARVERAYSMSSHHFHAVVWIDHHEARVFHFNPTDVERLVLHPDRPTKHIHHKANSIGSGHAPEDHAFPQAGAQSIAEPGRGLFTGAAHAK